MLHAASIFPSRFTFNHHMDLLPYAKKVLPTMHNSINPNTAHHILMEHPRHSWTRRLSPKSQADISKDPQDTPPWITQPSHFQYLLSTLMGLSPTNSHDPSHIVQDIPISQNAPQVLPFTQNISQDSSIVTSSLLCHAPYKQDSITQQDATQDHLDSSIIQDISQDISGYPSRPNSTTRWPCRSNSSL